MSRKVRGVFKLHILASGSKGNAAIVEETANGQCILIDCGISKRDFLTRCDEVSVDPANISDVLITHEHTDHTKGLGVVTRGLEKMGVAFTMRTSMKIRNASPDIADALKSENVNFCAIDTDQSNDTQRLLDVEVKAFQTSHDAVQSFGFRFESMLSSDTLAYLTDTGVVTDEAKQALQFARIVALESNHDIDMLMNGPYPYTLKKRISSERGHLSNDQAACALDELLSSLGGHALEHLVAMHISQENNTYDKPLAHLGEVVERFSHKASVNVSHQLHAISVG